nr:DNA polymerase III subunit delta' [Actinomycetota bacterium]
ARDEAVRIRRRDVITMPSRIRTIGDAIGAAADLASIADEETSASSAEQAGAERSRLLETLGADPAARTQPPHIRSQLAALEKEQRTRATRFARDTVDRGLVDLLSVHRDALVLHLGAKVGLVNEDSIDVVRALAAMRTPEELLLAMEAIGEARERINLNVAPLLALEAMTISVVSGIDPSDTAP